MAVFKHVGHLMICHCHLAILDGESSLPQVRRVFGLASRPICAKRAHPKAPFSLFLNQIGRLLSCPWIWCSFYLTHTLMEIDCLYTVLETIRG